jgi:hypothetical protein
MGIYRSVEYGVAPEPARVRRVQYLYLVPNLSLLVSVSCHSSVRRHGGSCIGHLEYWKLKHFWTPKIRLKNYVCIRKTK